MKFLCMFALNLTIMKKILLLLFAASTLAYSGCGTICGGAISDCQAKKPQTGQRAVRPAALIGDIFLFPVISLTVDFITGGMYKPCTGQNANTMKK